MTIQSIEIVTNGLSERQTIRMICFYYNYKLEKLQNKKSTHNDLRILHFQNGETVYILNMY